MEHEIIDSSWAPRPKKKKKAAQIGPRITIILENFGGIKRQVLRGFPERISIDSPTETIYRIGDIKPYSLGSRKSTLNIEMLNDSFTYER